MDGWQTDPPHNPLPTQSWICWLVNLILFVSTLYLWEALIHRYSIYVELFVCLCVWRWRHTSHSWSYTIIVDPLEPVNAFSAPNLALPIGSFLPRLDACITHAFFFDTACCFLIVYTIKHLNFEYWLKRWKEHLLEKTESFDSESIFLWPRTHSKIKFSNCTISLGLSSKVWSDSNNLH